MRSAEADTTQGAGLRQRVRAEFVEMPGLRLTVPQAARLWNMNLAQSQQVLSELDESHFLLRDAQGTYRRRDCPRCS